VVWADNLATFMAWFLIVLTFITCFVPDIQNASFRDKQTQGKGPRTQWYIWYDWLTDVVYVGLIVGAGHWFLGTMMCVAILFKQAASAVMDERLSQPKTEAA
jgi:ABC-type Mn2+/Zn2+ transport system permease subunit